MPSAAVEVNDLTMIYRKGREQFKAVDLLSIRMNAAEITSVLGPNGAGKTSTIEACEGFRRPDSGTIRVFGLDPRADASQLRPRVGVMLQDGGAWLGVRAGELLSYIASLYANPLDVPILLDRLGLGEHSKTTFRRLSGGQRQRLCLAMAVVGRPELVFLDEPTAGMDPHARQETWSLIRELRTGGAAVVLSTHHMDEAQSLSDRIHILHRGKLAASGTSAEILAATQSSQLIIEVARAADLRSIVAAIPALNRFDEISPGVCRFAVEATPELIAQAAVWCSHNAVAVRAIRIEQPTLEELFLDITKDTNA